MTLTDLGTVGLIVAAALLVVGVIVWNLFVVDFAEWFWWDGATYAVRDRWYCLKDDPS